MLDTSRSPKKVFPSHTPSLSSFSMPSGFGKRMPSSSPSIGISAMGSILGNSSSISLMRPIMGLSSSSFDLGMSGLMLEPSSPTSLLASSDASSDAVHFMRPTPPFEKNSDDLSKELGSSSSLNIELLEESPVAPLIENLLEPWLQQLRSAGDATATFSVFGHSTSSPKSSLLDSKLPVSVVIDEEFPIESVVASLLEYAKKHDKDVRNLMEAMNSPAIVVPYLNLDLPVDTIMQYNELDPDDPQLLSLQLDPVISTEIRELGVFIDRYDTEKSVICLLLWSTIDHALVCLPSLGLQPYPLCWKCNSSFGLSPCRKCGIARYCSEHCMAEQHTLHQKACSDMEGFVRRHRVLTLSPGMLSPHQDGN